MPGKRKIPYLSTEILIELPNDLPAPSTSRVLRPRSRATSLVRASPGSQPGSRASSSRSEGPSNSNSRLCDLRSRGDEYSMHPSPRVTGGTAISAVGETVDADDGLVLESIAGPPTPSIQAEGSGDVTSNQNVTGGSISGVDNWAPNDMSNWQLGGDVFGPLPQASGSSSHEKRKQGNSEDFSIPQSVDVGMDSWISPGDNSNFQLNGDDFRPPLRLGLDFGGIPASGSGSGASSSKRKRSPSFDSPEEPLSQRSWRIDLKAEVEVADQLLFNDAGQNSQSSQLSSGNAEKDRKGKGKARVVTPDPASVIIIPDTPPTTYTEVPPNLPTKPPADPLSSYTCPICFSPPTNATLTPCGHICCGACLFAAVKTTMQRATVSGIGPGLNDARCPVCRATIPGWDGKGAGVIGLKARAIFRL